VLWLRFAEELSVEETARVTGLTQTHVKVLVFRARQTLLKGEAKS
jgi:RNA polymerase sigma-70 factor (ECF subfamily)